MTKTSAAKKQSPAEQGLDDLIMMEGTDEGNNPTSAAISAPATNEATATAETTSAADYNPEDDELTVLGDGARVETFFIHKLKPGKTLGDNQVIIEKDQEFLGTYEGSFTSGRFGSRTHKITLLGETAGAEVEETIGLPTCGKLDKNFQYVPQGTKVLVKYNGSAVIKTGQWKGQDAYLYDVAVPKKVTAAIKAGELKANYELKESN